jgi:uncharacterized protein YbaP (TraB family)
MLENGDFDFPGPAGTALGDAYRDAEALVMEIRPDEADGAAMLAATTARAVDPGGRTLEELLGPAAPRVRAAAARRGVDLAPLARFEPWFASLVITVQAALRQGLAAEHGVERRVAAVAAQDGKSIAGLESVDRQLALFDELAPALQAELLLKTIDESTQDPRALEELIAAWRRGDQAELERLMTAEFATFPELRVPLVAARNRSWIRPVLELLDDERDYLIVVGALHLVGPDGVVALLQRRGLEVRRLDRSAN